MAQLHCKIRSERLPPAEQLTIAFHMSNTSALSVGLKTGFRRASQQYFAVNTGHFRLSCIDIDPDIFVTAIGLSPGGSSTVHNYTQTIHRTTQLTIWEECGPCPVFASYTLAFALQLRKMRGKTSVRVAASKNTRVGTLIVATIYLQLIQNRYMFRSFTVLQCSHQHCVQPVASDVEVVGYL